MNPSPKTIFCDIDGTIILHTGDIIDNCNHPNKCLENVLEQFKLWERLNYKIILTTGRRESMRKKTEKILEELGIFYDYMVMGLTNGDRVLINDKKLNGVENTAFAINLVRNEGMEHVDLNSTKITIPDKYLFTKVEKPWGYEELVECNDKYVVKKLFMKAGHSCSTQYHKLKRETIIIMSGQLSILLGKDMEHLEEKVYRFGETITINPYMIHKMRAIEDCLFLEGSTNELWDVVRLEDSYGRVPIVTDK
jgi:mannose-6-phosphate isomerase-like protein (cupin superfamily)